jgi:hypothetical protein
VKKEDEVVLDDTCTYDPLDESYNGCGNKGMGKDSMPMLDRPRLRTGRHLKNFGGMGVHDTSQSSPSPRRVFRSDRAPHHKFWRGVSLKAKRCLKSEFKQ